MFLAGCTGQRGNYTVDHRTSVNWSNAGGSCELLIGASTDSPGENQLLLALLAISPNAKLNSINKTGGDGIDVSATNIDYSANGPATFGYGSIWNRTSDKIAIDTEEFDRVDGNVFVIVPQKDDSLRIQIPGTCKATSPMKILEYVRQNCRRVEPELAILDTVLMD